MNAQYQADENESVNVVPQKPQYCSLYFVTHLILSFFAIYLSWRCGGSKFDALQFVAAICCPHLYIIWALAVHGGCGIFDGPSAMQPMMSSPSLV